MRRSPEIEEPFYSSKNPLFFEEPSSSLRTRPPSSNKASIFEQGLLFSSENPSSSFFDLEDRRTPSHLRFSEPKIEEPPPISNLRSSAAKIEQFLHFRFPESKNRSEIGRKKREGGWNFFSKMGGGFFEDGGFFDLPGPKNEEPPLIFHLLGP